MIFRLFFVLFALSITEPANAESNELEIASGALESAPIGEPKDAASQEIKDQTHAISKLLRCLSCHGLSVADSRADGAIAMKTRVNELLSLGYSQEQILDYFVDVYGEWILLKPDSRHWILLAAPVAVLLIGLSVVFGRSRIHPVSSESLTKIDVPPDDSVSEYRRRILDELEGD